MLNISLYNIEGELRGKFKAVSRFCVCKPPPPLPEYPQNAFFSKFPGGMPPAPPLYHRMVDL